MRPYEALYKSRKTAMIRIAADILECEMNESRPADRFMLWIDSVGGYMVSPSEEVVLGQPTCLAADVPILGDLGGRHAVIRREGNDYSIEALRAVSVNDRPLRGACRLRDGCRLRLGDSVRLLFRRPHAFSNTARLDFVSSHRTQPSADAVLLLADTCLLGPSLRCHVVCRAWNAAVLLYPRQGEIYCRTDKPVVIDGAVCPGGGRIGRYSRVEGDGFSFNLEPIVE